MLRRRVEKLERQKPLAAGSLIERWERVALDGLSDEEQALVQASSANRTRSKNQESDARAMAMQHYEEALANAIRDVSDAELDRMVLMLALNPSIAEAMA